MPLKLKLRVADLREQRDEAGNKTIEAVTLVGMTSGSPADENKDWAKKVPHAQFSYTLADPALMDQIAGAREVLVTIEPVK